MQSYSLFELNEYIRRVVALNFQEPLWVRCEIAQIKENRKQSIPKSGPKINRNRGGHCPDRSYNLEPKIPATKEEVQKHVEGVVAAGDRNFILCKG